MKRTTLAVTLAASILSAGAALADGAKHFRHGPYYAPVRPVVVPAPIYRPVVAHRPYVTHYHAPAYGYHHHRGYWRNGRWIAPVVLGAAVLGTIAAANHYSHAPAVTYVNPAPTYIAPAVTYSTSSDTFALADRDGNGFIDKWEASYDRNWERWFYDIDVNRDGYLSRDELRAWGAGRRGYN
jgi:hypothetical protein